MDTSAAALHPQAIASLADALAGADPERAVLRAIHAIAAQEMAVTVFSASICNVATHELERVYSSDERSYPIGLLKSKRGTSWARHVVQQRQVFVGEGPLEMAAAFDDKEKMASLGVRSIVNVPVPLPRQGLAVLNFGRAEERVPPSVVARARLLGLAATAGFALARA